MKGEAGAAATFAEIVQNTYGWNVMKPKAVDKELWDEIYNIYVKDKFGLGLQAYLKTESGSTRRDYCGDDGNCPKRNVESIGTAVG